MVLKLSFQNLYLFLLGNVCYFRGQPKGLGRSVEGLSNIGVKQAFLLTVYVNSGLYTLLAEQAFLIIFSDFPLHL